MRNKIKKITDSFQGCRFDMETIMDSWIIYFWDDNYNFFFELPNTKKENDDIKKAKIFSDNKWIHFEDDNIDDLIIKIKKIYGKKEIQ